MYAHICAPALFDIANIQVTRQRHQTNLHRSAPAATYSVHGVTTCMTMLPDGRTARMGGRVTKIQGNLPDFLVGLDAAWIVQDNGEGANAPADLASDIRFDFLPGGADLNCDVGVGNVFLRPIGDPGNIQVRP
jgi:hypothetical protein